MNMKRYIILVCGCLMTCLSACQQDDMDAGRTGRFNITLVDGLDNHASRALPSEINPEFSDELKQKFVISITDNTGTKVVDGQTLADYNQSSLILKPGTYKLTAAYGENPVLAFDSPYYVSEPVSTEIESNKVTDVTIPCGVGNALASFAFDEKTPVAEFFSDCSIMTKVGGNTLSFNLSGDNSQNPYFKEGSAVEFYLIGTTTADYGSKEVEYKFAGIDKAVKQKNYKYTIHLGESTTGNALFDISVDAEVETATLHGTIPETWLPKPKLTASGFDATNKLNYYETVDTAVVVNYTASRAITDFKVTFDFQDPNWKYLNKTYQVSSLTSEDKTNLVNAKIDLPELNTTSGSFDLSQLISSMVCADDGTSLLNTIKVQVLANGRWSDEQTYTVVANKPAFDIVYTDDDAWSKEFSIRGLNVTGGDSTKIANNLKYQYSATDGASWVDMNNGMTQKFAEVPEQKNYKVRAVYRGKMATKSYNVTMETPAQMPNSNMEEWYYERIHEDGRWNPFDSNTYTVYSWANGTASFWNTNNDFTTRHRGSTSNIYNCFPAVSFVPSAHGGNWAVELRNTGNGRGNTLPSNVLPMNKVAGELFTGDITVETGGSDAVPSGDHYTITEGRTFNVRPSALKFWYKYSPLNADTWRVIIKLLDQDGNTIIEKTHEASASVSDWTEETITLDYLDEKHYAKCAKIYIYFASTITPGDGMQYKKSDYTVWFDGESSFGNIFHGSTLTLDDILLVFDK